MLKRAVSLRRFSWVPKHIIWLKIRKLFQLRTLNWSHGPEVIKLFPCSTQLSTKFIMLINVKMPTFERLKARNFFIYRYFSVYEQLKFRAKLSWAWKQFYNLGPWSIYKMASSWDFGSYDNGDQQGRRWAPTAAQYYLCGLAYTKYDKIWGITPNTRLQAAHVAFLERKSFTYTDDAISTIVSRHAQIHSVRTGGPCPSPTSSGKSKWLYVFLEMLVRIPIVGPLVSRGYVYDLFKHGGESRDCKTTTMADIIEKPRRFRIFPIILVRFARVLKQIPREKDSNMPIVCDFRTKIWLKSYWRATDLVKKLLTSNRKIRLLVNNFLTRCLFAQDGRATFIFLGYPLQIPCQSDQY